MGLTAHIKLHGGKADRFTTIKQELADELGYEPSNPEVVGYLMAFYHSGNDSGETREL